VIAFVQDEMIDDAEDEGCRHRSRDNPSASRPGHDREANSNHRPSQDHDDHERRRQIWEAHLGSGVCGPVYDRKDEMYDHHNSQPAQEMVPISAHVH
jgi:hypothetical protein